MLIRIFKYLLFSSGVFFLLLIVLCFTPVPFHLWYNLSMKEAGIHRPPEWIVVLGGGGMPSETGLIRTWYAARLGIQYPQAKIIVALPGNRKDSLSSVCLMRREIIQKGISPDRIIIEDSGTNTRSQSLSILRIIDHANSPALLLVTSPEHVCRAVLAFRKIKFTRVDGFPAFERVIESDLAFQDRKLGGREWLPKMGKNISVRYRFWSQLKYLGLVGREYFAISYYWIKGWI